MLSVEELAVNHRHVIQSPQFLPKDQLKFPENLFIKLVFAPEDLGDRTLFDAGLLSEKEIEVIESDGKSEIFQSLHGPWQSGERGRYDDDSLSRRLKIGHNTGCWTA